MWFHNFQGDWKVRCSIFSSHEFSHGSGWEKSTEQRVLPDERNGDREQENTKFVLGLYQDKESVKKNIQTNAASPERHSVC